MKNLLLIIFLIAFCKIKYVSAQITLPVSTEFEIAYGNKTRSKDGKPGEKYWQNNSNYKLKVELDPKTRLLSGSGIIEYKNNSPDTLNEIVFRLYPDIFKRSSIRDGSNSISEEDLNDTGVNIESLNVNGKKPKKVERRGTNMFVTLNEPLRSNSKVQFEISWKYFIPKLTHIREGIYFKTSYFVAYWYPQIAVYDDIDGWDIIDYTGQQEFYNDFNNYEVEVTVPASHLIWATGVWQNPDKILKTEYLSLYKKALKSNEIINIISEADRKMKNISLSNTKHTFKFIADHVPDFAFTASDTYLWDMTSVIVNDSSKARTAVSAVYHKSSKDFYSVASYGQTCINYFSHKLPGIPFPYPNLTIFNGDGGMEFPMLVNDGSFGNQEAAEVAAHEIAHTYFPFFMGINERKYAWMDEGWAQTLPNDIVINVKGDAFKPQQSNSFYFQMLSKNNGDVPLITLSNKLNNNAYTNASYFRPSLAYAFLKDMLGDEMFGKTLREYMQRWNGKHPIPFDFFNSFNNYLNEDLSWYWKPWFFETGIPDLGIKEVRTEKGSTIITIEKKSNIPVPVYLLITFKDGSTTIIKETAKVWKEGSILILNRKFDKLISKIQLGNDQIPDSEMSDNKYEEQ